MNYKKYEGAGNSFLVYDLRGGLVPPLSIAALCQKEKVDGALFIEEGLVMRIFNRDGGEADMCGNGLRCIIKYLDDIADEKGLTYQISTRAGLRSGRVDGALVEVEMGPIQPIDCSDVTLVDTGVRHAVVFVEDLEAENLMTRGRELRKKFDANINFVKLSGDVAHVRVYERGVEAETLACGTGAVAVSWVSKKSTIITRSAIALEILIDNTLQSVICRGPAHEIKR